MSQNSSHLCSGKKILNIITKVIKGKAIAALHTPKSKSAVLEGVLIIWSNLLILLLLGIKDDEEKDFSTKKFIGLTKGKYQISSHKQQLIIAILIKDRNYIYKIVYTS